MGSIIAGGISSKQFLPSWLCSVRSQDTLVSPNGIEALFDVIYVDILSPGLLVFPSVLRGLGRCTNTTFRPFRLPAQFGFGYRLSHRFRE